MLARLIQLNAKLDLILLNAGRVANPLYVQGAPKGIHRIGKGRERTVLISRIISPQATVHEATVKSMAQNGRPGLPTLQHRGHGKYVCHDGNHGINAAILNGKRVIRVRAQR